MGLRDKVKRQARQKLSRHLRDAEPNVGNYIAGNQLLSQSMGLKVDYRPKPIAADLNARHEDKPHYPTGTTKDRAERGHAGPYTGSDAYQTTAPSTNMEHGQVPFRFRLLDYKISGHIPLGEVADYMARQVRNKQAARAYPTSYPQNIHTSIVTGQNATQSTPMPSANAPAPALAVRQPSRSHPSTGSGNEKASLFPEYGPSTSVLSTPQVNRERKATRLRGGRGRRASTIGTANRARSPSSPPPPYTET